MELGMGIEAGGIYASSFATTTTTTTSAAVDDNSGGGQNSSRVASCNRVEQLVVQFQITGGNAWASGVAYGMRQRRESAAAEKADKVQLVSLEVANMVAVWNGVSFEVPVR